MTNETIKEIPRTVAVLVGNESMEGEDATGGFQTTSQAVANLAPQPAGANPTATAGPAAVNGVAATFMRSDGAPAVQQFGTAQAGIAPASGGGTANFLRADGTWNVPPGSGGATSGNPTATAGPAAINGVAGTFMRSDAAPAIQKASAAQFGIVEVDGTTITATAGVIGVVATGGAIQPPAIGVNNHKIIKGNGSNQGAAVDDLTDIILVLDGGGAALANGARFNTFIDFAGTIQQVTELADQSGSVNLDIQVCSYANYAPGTHPVSGDSITAAAPPNISTASKYQDATLTGWTVALAAGSCISLTATGAATSITRVTCALKVAKS